MSTLEKICERCNQVFKKSYTCSLKDWKTRRFCCWDCNKLDSSLGSNQERSRLRTQKYRLKREYGMTLEAYNQMFQKQNGKCALCFIHQSELDRALSVDHNHSTKAIRGLLCHTCNRAIGLFNDDPSKLQRAIHYLRG